MSEEEWWFVERRIEGGPTPHQWLKSRALAANEASWDIQWTTDPHAAQKFATRQSAQQEAAAVSKLARVDAFPTGHFFCD